MLIKTVLLTMEQNRLGILHGGAIASMGTFWLTEDSFLITKSEYFILIVDLGGSLAVASQGLFATGVSTDLSGIFVHPNSKIFQIMFLWIQLINSLHAGDSHLSNFWWESW